MHDPHTLTFNEIQRIDDAAHRALEMVDDIQFRQWNLRCLEFHLNKGLYETRYQICWHMHKEMQIEVPLTGKFAFATERKPMKPLLPGNSFWIPPETRHRWRCDQSGFLLGITLAVVPTADSVTHPLQNVIAPGLGKKPVSLEFLQIYLEEIRADLSGYENEPRRFASWIHLVITKLLRDCIPAKTIEDEPNNSATGPKVRNQRIIGRIIRFIDANLAEDLSMESLQKGIGLSTRQIQRMFVEHTGGSCHRFIMDRRLETARSMIQSNPSLSMKEVAHSCGFVSTAHFSTRFRKSFGVTPSNYKP